MPDETLKSYWVLMTQLRRGPTVQTYALAIQQAEAHSHPKVRTAIRTFLDNKRKMQNVA